jgi:His Kinase A (phospho-acceptor) domain
MLETLDPVNRVAPARDDRERRVAEVARGPRHAGDGSDHEAAIADARACDGAGALAEDDRAAARPWSGDWLQLSHELRTPLNAMLGNIELLLDGSAGPLSAPVRACVGDLQVASRQLLRQLQPLLLLVQARTAGAVASGPPIDLLALLRQAAAGSAPASPWCVAQGQDALPRRAAPRLPEGRCLMMAGDPVWLGALAATLVDLHGASPQAAGPLSIDLTEVGEAPGGKRVGTGGTVLRAFWPGLEPTAVSPLPLALIDAVLALHGGRIRSLDADGLRLDLPGASVVQCSTSARGHR